MRLIKSLVVVASIAACAACGGKDKKPAAPQPVQEPVATETQPEPEAPAPAPAPEKDPASLGEIIYFEFDSSDLSPDARAQLEENAAWLKENPARVLTIEGHTDEVGTPEYNLGLGERRARAAKDYLVRLGIQDPRVDIITYGEERPASSEDAANRRSVFVATRK